MYLRRTTTSPGRGFQGVPVTIFSALSFHRSPSTSHRTDRAGTAPVSKPMMCSSLRCDFPSQIAVRQRSARFVRSAVLGSLYQIASPNIAVPAVYSRPLSLEYPVLPSAQTTQDPSTVSDQPWQQRTLILDLHLCFLLQVDAKASHKPTEFLINVLSEAHRWRGVLGSTLDDSFLAPGVLYCYAQCTDCQFAIDAKEHLLPSPCSQVFDHRRDHVCSCSLLCADCRHHAESIVEHVQDCEQLFAWCVLHKAAVGYDDGELWFFVWLSVMWTVCGSGSYAVAAPISGACVWVCELARGLLRCIRTDGNALTSGFPLLFECSTRLVTPQHQIRC